MPSPRKLYLVDVSSFIYRAFFAIRNLTNRNGQPTNAVFGVANMLARVFDEAKPEYIAIVFDSKEPSFRKEIYTDYKANRSAPPDDLVSQFPLIENLITALGIPNFRESGIEADDVIATLAKKWITVTANEVVIITGDKDLMQLVDDRVCVWDTMTDRTYRPAEVAEKFGIRPDQVRDYLALVGDSSDNIPGVEGIGTKTAVGLLNEFHTLDGVLAAAHEGRISGKRGETLVKNEKEARLSANLASLRSDLNINPKEEELRYKLEISSECLQILKDLDLRSLITKWQPYFSSEAAAPSQSIHQAVSVQVEPKLKYKTISSESEFIGLLSAIDKTKEFGFDLETTSLNPRQAELVGVAIAYDKEFGCYIPVGHRIANFQQLAPEFVLEKLRPFLENPRYKKIGQNLKYDWSVLCEHGLDPDGIGADTMLASYVLDPEGRHNLQTVASKYLNYSVLTYEQVCGKGASQLCFDQLDVETASRYSSEDAWVALHLWDHLRPKLNEEHLMEVFARVELPLVRVLADIECAGVSIDVPWLKQLSGDFEKQLRQIEEKVQSFAHNPALNLNSPKQLAKLLFDDLHLPVQNKTKTGYSTDASVLETLAQFHEVPRLLLEYREIAKLKGTYVDPLPLMQDPKSGRIHASFHQTVTATGRLSSSDPNLQNIPIRTDRGKLIRRGFIASPGNILLAADYSQIELRLLAEMSSDKELCESFINRNEDVHRRTASEIFDVPVEKVDDRQRGIAKAVNFGLMYGKTAFGLAQELRIPRREAQDVITKYFERYSGVKKFLDEQILQAREKGFSSTLLGRKRYLREISSKNAALRANAERMAMNAPIQGTAADLIKLAMINIHEELKRKGLKSKLIIQVHDEVVLECPLSEVDEVQTVVVMEMEHAMDEMIKLRVPMKVNAERGKNWAEL